MIRGLVLNRSKRQETTLIPKTGDWGYKRGHSHRVEHDAVREKNRQVCCAIMGVSRILGKRRCRAVRSIWVQEEQQKGYAHLFVYIFIGNPQMSAYRISAVG